MPRKPADADAAGGGPKGTGILFPLLMLVISVYATVLGRQAHTLHMQSKPTEWNTTYAKAVLTDLTAEGPRLAGSARSDRVRQYLTAEFKAIGEIAKAHGAKLEVDHAMGSGAFYTDFIEGFTNVYHNISSVVARLSWPQSRRDAVLVNAHYDSFPGSPGASDDGIHVALALGMARSLASGPAQGVSVLFLLNGAEESNWVAAHAFATRHPWARDYRAVFNLEAVGAGGEAIIFQLGADAMPLAKALRSARGPRGTAIAHDLFQIPGFPAGTDLKTLIAHAPSPPKKGNGQFSSSSPPLGLDLAILGNGYVYHTPSDDLGHVPDAQIRELGARVTSMLRALVEGLDAGVIGAETSSGGSGDGVPPHRQPHENVQSIDGDTHGIYFDYAGLIWVSYSRSTAMVVHGVSALLALAAMRATGAGASLCAREGVALLSSLVAAALIGALVWKQRPMASAYGQHLLAAALYGSLALSVALRVRDGALFETSLLRKNQPVPPSVRALGAASLSPWLVTLALFEYFGRGSAYLPALICASNGLALLLAERLASTSAALATAVQVLGALIPSVHLGDICGWLIEVLVPITGRAGVVLPSDVVIGALLALIAVLGGGPLTAPLHTGSRKTIRRLCWLLFLASFAALALAWVRFPIFQPSAPKRLIVHHVEREVNGASYDSGLWVSGFDAAGLREIREVKRKRIGLPAVHEEIDHGCDLDLPTTGCYLSLPYYFPLSGMLGKPDGKGAVYATKMTKVMPVPGQPPDVKKPMNVPIEPPPIPFTERLRLERFITTNSSGSVSRLSMRVTGPSHMALVLPEERLVRWSLTPGPIPKRRSPFAPDERVAFAFLTSGGEDGRGDAKKARVWDLWVEVEGESLLELAVYGHYPELGSSELDTLKGRMPPGVKEGTWHWFPSMLSRWSLQMRDGKWRRLAA